MLCNSFWRGVGAGDFATLKFFEVNYETESSLFLGLFVRLCVVFIGIKLRGSSSVTIEILILLESIIAIFSSFFQV